jgi:membrane protease YdiL (CAAX protease family)
VLLDKFVGQQPEGESLGAGLWIVLPLVAVILLRFFAGDGWKDTGFRPNFKGNAKWYVIALLAYPLIILTVFALGKMSGWIDFTNFRTEVFFTGFIVALLPNFVKNIFEESVWRGYLTGKLEKLNMNDWTIYAIVGIVWGLWHLPYNLVFASLDVIHSVLPVNRLVFTLTNLLLTFSLTIFYTELYRIVKSVWATILFHTLSNAIVNTLFVGGMIYVMSGKEFLLSPVVGVVPMGLYVMAGLILRRYRIKLEYKKEARISQESIT